jgi:ABC-type antimicrobial peptide transport system permease subunit
MTARVRKAVGGVAMMVFLAAYIWAAASLGERVPSFWLAKLAYYLVAGTAWGVPLIPLMAWMNRGR